jgi:hypothetical protein
LTADPADRITVTVHDDQVGDLEAVAERLRGAGMTIDQVFAPLGIITGTVDQEHRSALEKVPGVAAVEAETSFRPRSEDGHG